jgi:hypothetical protein
LDKFPESRLLVDFILVLGGSPAVRSLVTLDTSPALGCAICVCVHAVETRVLYMRGGKIGYALRPSRSECMDAKGPPGIWAFMKMGPAGTRGAQLPAWRGRTTTLSVDRASSCSCVIFAVF